jgi:hypothetical protein
MARNLRKGKTEFFVIVIEIMLTFASAYFKKIKNLISSDL